MKSKQVTTRTYEGVGRQIKALEYALSTNPKNPFAIHAKIKNLRIEQSRLAQTKSWNEFLGR